MFHDMPDTSGGWSELPMGNTPFYRRGAGSVLELNFEPNSSKCFSYALIFSDAQVPGNTTASITQLIADADNANVVWHGINTDACLETKQVEIPAEAHDAVFQIFPNPSKDILYIQSQELTGTELTIRLVNALGQVVYATTITSDADNSLYSIDVRTLAAGYYMLQYSTPDYSVSAPVCIQ
jgi:hypothetical protein